MIRPQSDQQYPIEIESHAQLRTHFDQSLWNKVILRMVVTGNITHPLRLLLWSHIQLLIPS